MNFANFSADSNDFLISNQDNLCNSSTPCGGIENSDPKCQLCNDVAKFHPINGCLKFSPKKVRVKKDSIFGNSISHSIRYVSRKISSVVSSVVITCLNHYVEFSCALGPAGIYYYDKDLFQKHQLYFMSITTMSLLAAKMNYTLLSIGEKAKVEAKVEEYFVHQSAPSLQGTFRSCLSNGELSTPPAVKSNFGFDLRGPIKEKPVTKEKLADNFIPNSENVLVRPTIIESYDSDDSDSDSSEYQKIEA